MELEALNLFLIDDQSPQINFNIVGEIVNDLAQPLEVPNNEERQTIPRNQDFFETTIPLYMGDLFKEHFRMTREAFEVLTNVVGNVIPEVQFKIPLEKKLLFTIWVISKPESFLAAGDRFAMTRSTAHTVFTEIIKVFRDLMPEYIRWPTEYNMVEEPFHHRYHIPGVVGAIDGCHIEIKQPPENANDYYNRNSYHSIILQGICDAQMKFLDIYVGAPGRVHDARVFTNSPIFERIHQMPRELHILGDSAYPLSINVITPFRDNGHLNEIHTNFNVYHSIARSVIERAFGRLKGKFRRLKYLNISNVDFGCEIISAACMLYNFIIMQNADDEEFQPDIGILNEFDGNEGDANVNLAIAKRNEIAELLL